MKPLYLILNPTAKSGHGKKNWDLIFNSLREEGLSFELGESQYSGHSVKLSTEAALSNKYEYIVAVGGDGTINEVLNGLREASNQSEKIPPLGILYTGTSPDICKYHQIPLNLLDAVKCLKKGNAVPIDIGEVDFTKEGKEITSKILNDKFLVIEIWNLF